MGKLNEMRFNIVQAGDSDGEIIIRELSTGKLRLLQEVEDVINIDGKIYKQLDNYELPEWVVSVKKTVIVYGEIIVNALNREQAKEIVDKMFTSPKPLEHDDSRVEWYPEDAMFVENSFQTDDYVELKR
jgi:hypothetical protein